MWNTHVVLRSTYSERASKADDRMLRGNINRWNFVGNQTQDGRDVDQNATVAPFVLTHVLEPQ